MALPTNADVIVVHGYWLDELTGLGVKQANGLPATIMFDPVPLLGANTAKTPNLRDLTSNAHLKTRTRVATVDPATGYYATQLVASNDPDLDAYGGRKVTLLGEDPFTIEVPYNASAVTVDAQMAAKTGLTQGSSVKAIWLTSATIVGTPPPQPANSYLTSSQTLATIASGIEAHDEDPDAHADIRALITSANRSIRSVSTNTTAVAGELLKVDASSGARTMTPPVSPSTGTKVTLIKTDASANAVTWSGTVDGDSAGAQLTSQWVAVSFVWDGSVWLVESTTVSPTAAGASGNGGFGQVLVTDFGADATGVASSTTAFQNAINAGDVVMPAGTYKVGKITYEGNASRRIVALGPVKIIQTSGLGLFNLRGGWDAIGTVSSYANATVNLPYPGEPTPSSSNSTTTVLTMSSAVSLNFNDIVKVVCDDQIVTAPSSNSRRGEYAVIPKPVTSSTTVPLSNALIETYTTNVRLARLWDVRFEISGPIVFDVDPSIVDATNSEPVIYLKAAKNCYVGGGVEFHNSIGRAVANFAYATHVDGVRFSGLRNRPTYSQFGYGVEDGGWQTRLTGCVGENLRHLYTDNDGDTTTGSTLFENYGGGWFGHVSDCVVFGSAASSFDTHGTAYGTVFADCRAYGAYNGADTGGTGFSARGRKITFMNCVADQCYEGFVTRADDTTFVNCRAQKTMAAALSVDRDTGSAATTLKVSVIGGLYESAGYDEYVNVYLGNSNITSNIEITGATFRKLTAPGNGLRMFEVAPNVNLKLTDVTLDWSGYVRNSADTLNAFLLTGAGITVQGRRLVQQGGSANVAAFSMFKSSTSAANPTSIDLYDIEHRHASLAATVIDSALTNARTSWQQYYGTSRSGSNDLTLTAAASAALPITDKLDRTVSVRLTGSGGAVTLAALPTTAAVPGQTVNVANGSNGAVTISGQTSIAVGATASYLFAQGAWWALATASSGGGGGSSAVFAKAALTSGNLSLANVNWTTVDTSLDLVMTAAAGNWVEVSLNARVFAEEGNELYLDACTVVSGSTVNWLSGGTAGSHYGQPGWTMPGGYRGSISGVVRYQLQSGDISGGTVTIRLQYYTANASPTRSVGALAETSGFPLLFSARVS